VILLMRHKTSVWNTEPKRCAGRTDIDLSAVGREQARRAGEVLPMPSAVYSSPLMRARDTASTVLIAIARTTGRLRAPDIDYDGRLQEADFGAWEGLYLSDIAKRWPEEWASLARRDLSLVFPGGESLRAVRARMAAALSEIRDRHGDEELVLVVTHGTALRALTASEGTHGPGSG